MNEQLWQSVLGEIELAVTRGSFVTWFKNTSLINIDQDEVVVGVPNIFAKQQLEARFNDLVKEALAHSGVDTKNIQYKISSVIKPRNQDNPRSIRLDQPAAKDAPAKPQVLNTKYTFESFIVGGGNELAHAACQAIVDSPGHKYNPLFVYGGVGVGKTHLIQAVGNEITNRQPDIKVLYISCETFVKEFLESIRFKKKFSDRYRKADVLIVDDIQFIAGKEKTQEEFFHTFNALHQANKQVIISSDQPPKSIPTLEDRLRSRFEGGMMIDIQPPDFETRSAILQAKAELRGQPLPADVVEYLATHVQSNIRELEGALNQLLAWCEMRGLEPDKDIAVGLLGSSRGRPRRLTAKQVIERTAKYFQVDITELVGPKRDKEIVVPRQIAMYLLRSELHMSFPKVAHELGRKDHTTAIHSVDKIEKNLLLDHGMRQSVNEIRERLYG